MHYNPNSQARQHQITTEDKYSLKGRHSKLFKEFYQHLLDTAYYNGDYELNHLPYAKKFNVCTKTISRWLKKLSTLGLIANYRCGQNFISTRAKGALQAKKTRFTVVAIKKANNKKKNVHLSLNRDNISMYTKNPDQILLDRKENIQFNGHTSDTFKQEKREKAKKFQKLVFKAKEKQIKIKEQEIKELESKPLNRVSLIFINAKKQSLQKLRHSLEQFKEVMKVFFYKLKYYSHIDNISQRFWLICNKFRIGRREIARLFMPQSYFKVNFKPRSYEQESELIKNFPIFKSIKNKILTMCSQEMFNYSLQGYRKKLLAYNHEKSDYWQSHKKFKLSSGKYYTIEILNFEFLNYVKGQILIKNKKLTNQQKYMMPHEYCVIRKA